MFTFRFPVGWLMYSNEFLTELCAKLVLKVVTDLLPTVFCINLKLWPITKFKTMPATAINPLVLTRYSNVSM